jgi:hypothetical protein
MCERAEAFNTEVLRFLPPGDDTGK